MYLRLVRFTLSDASGAKAREMADELIPAIKEHPGCLSAAFFGGGPDGESGLSVLWDTEEHADSAAAAVGPRLLGHLSGNVKGEPEIHLYPVLTA